jgi:ubiquitin carboxyl-terminal hydrolase 25
MDAAEGYSVLNIENRTLDDPFVEAAYVSMLDDQPEHRDYYNRALQAIAEDRNSSFLKSLLPGNQSQAGAGNEDEPVGLDNIGNTCYLNSLLQFLFTVVDLRQIVLNFDDYKMDTANPSSSSRRIGQRQVSKKEVETAQKFVVSLGHLFRGMIETSNMTIRPEKELARLTLETHSAVEKLRRRSTLQGERPSLGHIDSQPLLGPLPAPTNQQILEEGEDTVMVSPQKELDAISPKDQPVESAGLHESMDHEMTNQSDNSSEATLLSRQGTPSTPVNIEQQKEILDNKENLSPVKQDGSPKRGDVGGEHPEPLVPMSPSKINEQAGALAMKDAGVSDATDEPHIIEATPKYAPPPGKPPPVPPRKPVEPSTDSILEEYARQQDVTEVIAHCLFQFSSAIKGNGVDATGEQQDEIHETFFGQTILHTVPEKEPPSATQFNHALTRVVNKPKDVYEALDNEYDLAQREDGSTTFTSISKLPPIFSVLLDRVGYDTQRKTAMKHEDHVEVHEKIFLDRYIEATPDSNLMQRRRQAWEMKRELAKLTSRRVRLEENVCNGRSMPALLADAKETLDFLRTNPDFTTPDGEEDDELDALMDPTTSDALGALANDLSAELAAIKDRTAHLEQQLKEAFADMRKYPYRLHAVFFHRGMAGSGHYWVYIYDHKKECWRRYNDDRVNIVTDRNEIFTKPPGSAVPTPYFLVYVKEEEVSTLVETVKRDIVYSAPAGPPPLEDDFGWSDWSRPDHQGPMTQMQAMPPNGETREVNGGIGAWDGESSQTAIDPSTDVTSDPQASIQKSSTWQSGDVELTKPSGVQW